MAYILVFIFIVLDFLTGTTAAVVNGEWTSTVMRQGLISKVGTLLCVAFGVAVELAGEYFKLGFGFQVSIAICVYIMLMEAGSIMENLGKISPNLVPKFMRDIFAKLKGTDNE